MKSFVFWLKFHRSLFLWVQLTISQHVFFDVFFDLHLKKRLNNQSWDWWFETASRSLWCHRDAVGEIVTMTTLWKWNLKQSFRSLSILLHVSQPFIYALFQIYTRRYLFPELNADFEYYFQMPPSERPGIIFLSIALVSFMPNVPMCRKWNQ